MLRRVVRFFRKGDDRIRGWLTKRPVAYALVGGVGVVLFWKGVWETAGLTPLLFGPSSLLLGAVLLTMTGLLISVFLGDRLILADVAGEEKLVEKEEKLVEKEERLAEQTERDVHSEKATTEYILNKIDKIDAELEHIEKLEEKHHEDR